MMIKLDFGLGILMELMCPTPKKIDTPLLRMFLAPSLSKTPKAIVSSLHPTLRVCFKVPRNKKHNYYVQFPKVMPFSESFYIKF